VDNLNRAVAQITRRLASEELIAKLRAIRLPCSKIQSIPEVIADPLVEPELLHSQDPATGLELTLAPPPYSTPFLEENGRRLSFPPRFGQHNAEIYGKLGYGEDELGWLREQGVI
jgi:formyl-CoA transferase